MRVKVPTRKMLRDYWEDKRQRRQGDTVDLIEGEVYLNGVRIQNVLGLEMEREVRQTLGGRFLPDSHCNITLRLVVRRGVIEGGAVVLD